MSSDEEEGDMITGMATILNDAKLTKDAKVASMVSACDGLPEFSWDKVTGMTHGCEESMAVLSETLKSNSSIRKLDLSHQTLSDGIIVTLAEALKVNTSVTELFLRGCAIERGGGLALSEMLSLTSSLCTLDLSGNTMGTDVTRALFDALKGHRSLRKLKIPVFPSDRDMETLAGYIESAPSLLELDIGSMSGCSENSTSIVADALIKNSSLQKLSITFVNEANARHLSRYLESTGTLTTLIMSMCVYGDDWVTPIMDAIKKNPTLTTIQMDSCYVGDKGAALMSEILAHTPSSLEILQLQKCGVKDGGLQDMANALTTNQTLQTLSVTDCKITESGASYLADMLKQNGTLVGLDLSGTKIKDEGVASIAEALKQNTSLKVLVMHECFIGKGGAEELSDMIEHNATLQTLELANNYTMGTEGRTALEKAMEGNSTIVQMGIDTPKLYGLLARNRELLRPGHRVKPARPS